MTEVPHVYCIMVGGTGSTVGDGMRRFHVGGWSGEPAIDISERNRGMCVRERLDQARRPEGKQAIMASSGNWERCPGMWEMKDVRNKLNSVRY